MADNALLERKPASGNSLADFTKYYQEHGAKWINSLHDVLGYFFDSAYAPVMDRIDKKMPDDEREKLRSTNQQFRADDDAWQEYMSRYKARPDLPTLIEKLMAE